MIVDIDGEALDKVTIASLLDTLDTFENWDCSFLPLFSSDPDEEKKKVKKMKKSVKILLAWYGAEGYMLEDYL